MDRPTGRDEDLDGLVDGHPGNAEANIENRASSYAMGLVTQLRKGYLAYCVLLICRVKARYTSEIISTLSAAELVVVEGTIYPLLSRLQKDNLLKYEWRESEQGPPRKYYLTTNYGQRVVKNLKREMDKLDSTFKSLEKGVDSERDN